MISMKKPASTDVALCRGYKQLFDNGIEPTAEQLAEMGATHADTMELLINAYKQDGKEPLQRAWHAILNREKRLQAIMATLPPVLSLVSKASDSDDTKSEGEEEEDARFIKHDDGKRSIKLASIDDIYALPDAKYLISKIIETVGTSLLYGCSGTGKTFTALNLALCVAHGIHWFGRRVEQGTVIYINTEGGRGLKKRLQAWYKEHPQLSPSSDFKVIPWPVNLQGHYQELIETIKHMEDKPILIVIDNFSMCVSVDQDKQKEVAPVLGAMTMLAQDHSCHVMIVHHTNKTGDFNGSQAFKNHVDEMIELKKEDPADRNSAILFCSEKTRDEAGFTPIKTELKIIDLYTDANTLETITSCVVVESEAPVKEPGLKPVQQDVLDVLGDEKLSHSEWKKRCEKDLKISKATFDRTLAQLKFLNKIGTCKVDGFKHDHYYKIITPTENVEAWNA